MNEQVHWLHDTPRNWQIKGGETRINYKIFNVNGGDYLHATPIGYER